MFKKSIVVAILGAVVLKAIYLLQIIKDPSLSIYFGDPNEYYNLARQLLEGQYISATRPPLYPVFLSIFLLVFGEKIFGIVQIVQYTLGILTGLFIYKHLEDFTSNFWSVLGFCFYACNPLITLYESSFFSESLFIPLLTLSSIYFVKQKYPISYTLLTLAILTRPVALVFALIFIIYHLFSLFQNQKLKQNIRSLVYSTIPLIGYIGWSLYQKFTFGYLFFSTIGAFNVGLYQANFIYSAQENLPIHEARKKWILHIYDKYKKEVAAQEQFLNIAEFPDTSVFSKGYTAYWKYQQYPMIVKVAFNETLKLYIRNPGPVIKYTLRSLILAPLNNGLYPLMKYFGVNQKVKKYIRLEILDNALHGNIKNALKGLLKLITKSNAFVILITFTYNFITFLLFLLLIANLTKFKNLPEYQKLAIIIFITNWFVAGFVGLGGVRYFIGGYPFLIFSAIPPRSLKFTHGFNLRCR